MTSPANAIEHDDIFWKAAYEAHASTVLGFLRRRVGGGAEAEDLLQEVFVRAIRAGSFRRDGNLRAYLLSIARNLVINQRRRPRLVVLMDRDDDGSEPMERVPDTGAGPDRRAEWTDFARSLARCLGELSDDHRAAFELGVLQQKPYAEIARLQGWSLAQVKVNLHRARRRILDAMGDSIPNRPASEGGTGGPS